MLDTHAFLWWLADSSRLSTTAHSVIADDANRLFVSAASAWEITTKHRIGRLPEATDLTLDVAGAIARQGFEALPITVADAELAGRLPGPHRDPFDRILVAQAIGQHLALVSRDTALDQFAIQRLW